MADKQKKHLYSRFNAGAFNTLVWPWILLTHSKYYHVGTRVIKIKFSTYS